MQSRIGVACVAPPAALQRFTAKSPAWYRWPSAIWRRQMTLCIRCLLLIVLRSVRSADRNVPDFARLVCRLSGRIQKKNTMSKPASIVASALVTGSIASVVSTLTLAALARQEGRSAAQPTNATSHWLHGEEAAYVAEIDPSTYRPGFRNTSRIRGLLGFAARSMVAPQPAPVDAGVAGQCRCRVGARRGGRLRSNAKALHPRLGARFVEVIDGRSIR